MPPFRRSRESGEVVAIYVHAGAGFHSYLNERQHLQACADAASCAFTLLKTGSSALDAVELAIKIFEDKEITNAGYGSNLCMDGTVECDASIVDHFGRSGGAGAVSNVKNPIGLARIILDETTKPMTLQRVPPNLLVGQGALDFANERGMITVFNDFLISKGAKERWNKWKRDLDKAEESQNKERARSEDRSNSLSPASATSRMSIQDSTGSARSSSLSPRVPAPQAGLLSSSTDVPVTSSEAGTGSGRLELPKPNDPTAAQTSAHEHNIDGYPPVLEHDAAINEDNAWRGKRRKLTGNQDGSFDDWEAPLEEALPVKELKPVDEPEPHSKAASQSADRRQDLITDTVGAIAVDAYGNIAAGSSSGGIGMKHRGRCGPAALVGIGAYVIPRSPEDPDGTCVATVTSGTGEHMATTLAAATSAERLFSSSRKIGGGQYEECSDEQALRHVIDHEFMEHPGVQNSHCAGAIGILAVKKTKDRLLLNFAHNTDSFAVASMQSGDKKPVCVMSRNTGNGATAMGGRVARTKTGSFRP